MNSGNATIDTRARRRIDEARAAADLLGALGYPAEAEAVRRICRTYRSSHETNRRLHADNLALRRSEDSQ